MVWQETDVIKPECNYNLVKLNTLLKKLICIKTNLIPNCGETNIDV
jgi:hypothetical protein